MHEMARDWLVRNGYNEEAAKIESILKKWRESGVKTRRNWWEVLAGQKNGLGRVIEGVEFPVIKVIRERMGLPPNKGSICKNKNETAPIIEKQKRWKGHKKKRRKKWKNIKNKVSGVRVAR